jgi:hypothetical protein
MIAKFDLETLQMDAVNAFVHTDLDELVHMRMPPGFAIPGRVLKLSKQGTIWTLEAALIMAN